MHTLILGRSFTGKSAKAKQLGTDLRIAGEKVLAFNPTHEAGYTRQDAFGCIAADFETDNPAALVREIDRYYRAGHTRIFVIVDEAHEFFERGNCEYAWIGTKGRHFGIHVIAVTQRAALLNTTFRGQCSVVFAFAATMTDVKFLTEEFWAQGISSRQIAQLKPGEYIKITQENVSKGSIKNW